MVRSTGQSTQQSELSEPRSSSPTEPTATPRPRIPFPPESDGAALTALFDATDGESWQNSDGWLYTEDLGQWHGVTTDAAGRVTELNLRDNRLSGELPEELGSLTGLTELDLRDNQLSGALPPELGSLTNLTELNLSGTGLSGAIPPELGRLASLEKLWLNSNQLSGAVPAELGSLADLTLLYLDTNQLSGELPSELGNLSELRRVSVWGNNLTGADHYANGLLSDMVALVAFFESTGGGEDWCYHTGCNWQTYLPLNEWFRVTAKGGRVTELNIGGDLMTGRVPPELGLLSGLQKLHLLETRTFSGCIPSSLRGIEYIGDLPFCSGP